MSEAELRSFIDRLRNHYVDQFRQAAEEMAAEDYPVAPEIKLKLGGSGDLYENLWCVDFVKPEPEPQVIEFGASYVLKFSPMIAEVAGLIVLLRYTTWDDVLITHDADPPSPPGLEDWFDYWFDLEDDRQPEGSELGNVIHSLLVRGNRISVDFGSAETEALWNLLEVLEKAGATYIRISAGREEEEEDPDAPPQDT